jgi:hypothetical protein
MVGDMEYEPRQFIPKFRHLAVLMFSALALAVFAVSVKPPVAYILGAASVLFSEVARRWIVLLKAERGAALYIASQDADQNHERSNVEAVAKFAQSISGLPPAAQLQALGKMFPELDFQSIVIQPETVQMPRAADGFTLQKYLPGGLLKDSDYRRLAIECIQNGAGLGYDFWTENNASGPVLITRNVFEKFLKAAEDSGYVRKLSDGKSEWTPEGLYWLESRWLPRSPAGGYNTQEVA